MIFSFCAIRILIPINPIGVSTCAISSSTTTSAWWPALGRIPNECFSNADRSPRNLPEIVICTPIAPLSIICCNVHIVTLLNAVPRWIWAAILLHITFGDNSGFFISSTAICGFFNWKSVSNLLVNSLIPVPFLPITIPGLVTKRVILVPVGVLATSTFENPASLISFLRKSFRSIKL